ncbi:MAG: phosphoglucosamine mutase [Candidatus Nezhaarchaeales archaeon]
MKRLFSTSGIRGMYPNEVSPTLAFKLGCALTYIFGKECTVGIDGRLSSPVLEYALISGLMYSGCHVRRIGLAPLPITAYSVKKLGVRFGVMVTASHNPPEYNGFKVFREGGWELMPSEEELVEETILRENTIPCSWSDVGSCISYREVLSEYVSDLLDFLLDEDLRCPTPGLKVVVDCCNGPAALVTPMVLTKLGAKVVAVNANIDGHFPGREPEPRPDVLVDLGRFVGGIGAKMGIAHDGDADRVAIIDSNGSFVANDRIIAYMAKRALEHGEGRIVITTIDTSRCIDEVVDRLGGEVVRTKLGKTHVELSKRSDVALAAEPWKIINPKWGPWADGILTAATLIRDLMDSGKSLQELLSDIPYYPQIRESYPCSDEEKIKVMKRVEEELESVIGNVDEVWNYDGVRVNCKDGSWILIRASGTEPKIRIYAEARSLSRLNEIVEKGRKLVFEALKA